MKKTLLLLLALVVSATAWAIEQDSDGYYLIGSIDDWKAFAELATTTHDANARMIADIDLGDDQTKVGALKSPYKGTFDGQGFTLTVQYDSTDEMCAPFYVIGGATIRNLHTEGSITSTRYHSAGIVGKVHNGTVNVVERCISSVNIAENSYGLHGGLIGNMYFNSTLTLTDCIFNGKIVGTAGRISSALIGRINSGTTLNASNCFINGTYDKKVNAVYDGELVPRSTTNTFYVGDMINAEQGATQATAEQLVDGTITQALQAGRDEEVWVQGDDGPMLSIFANGGLKRDAEGYYLLGSAIDWNRFAAIVAENPTANARMIADIDLGDSQTQIGDTKAYTSPSDKGSAYHYQGTFDGQGHTLTIAYTGESGKFTAPFPNVRGAKIYNLHIDGTMYSPVAHAGGVVSCLWGDGNEIKNCWVSVDITSNGQSWDECGAIVGCMKNGTVDIVDCLFTGSLTSPRSYNGSFLGYENSGTAIIANCLSTGTFNYGGSYNINCYGAELTNCFIKQFPGTIPEAMQCTDEQLADGTIATALQGERDEVMWVQYGRTPMLRLFLQKGDMNIDGKVDVEDVNAIINIILNLKSTEDYLGDADIVKDGKVDIEDVNAAINIILLN